MTTANDELAINYYKEKYPDDKSTYAEKVKKEDIQGLIPTTG